jgi:hypothetical protein
VVRIRLPLTKTSFDYLVPARFTFAESIDVLPQHLQPSRRYPFLTALEGVVDEPHQHARRLVSPQANNLYFGQLVSFPGSIRPSLTGLHSRQGVAWVE